MKAQVMISWNGSTIQSVVEFVYTINGVDYPCWTARPVGEVERYFGVNLGEGIVELEYDCAEFGYNGEIIELPFGRNPQSTCHGICHKSWFNL